MVVIVVHLIDLLIKIVILVLIIIDLDFDIVKSDFTVLLEHEFHNLLESFTDCFLNTLIYMFVLYINVFWFVSSTFLLELF
jgi:hypothetical protein